jgi:hypothetical protein
MQFRKNRAVTKYLIFFDITISPVDLRLTINLDKNCCCFLSHK